MLCINVHEGLYYHEKRNKQKLIDLLKNSKNRDIRRRVVGALGDFGDKRAVPSLIDALRNDKDFLVKMFAAQSLGKLGDKRAVKSLIVHLNNYSHRWVKTEAALALRKILKSLTNKDQNLKVKINQALKQSK